MTASALRPATPEDEPFLRTVYAAARAGETAGFGWPDHDIAAFLAVQFDAQRRHYTTAWPHAVDRIVEVGGIPAGRIWTDHGTRAVTVLDLALLPPVRGAGIGTALLRDLQTEATALGVPIDLQTPLHSRSLRLYRRLGFQETGDDGMHHRLRWTAGTLATHR